MKHLQRQKNGSLAPNEVRLLNRLYSRGKAAYGSITNLQKASNLPRWKVELFLKSKNAHTKYHLFKLNFPRLKVIAFRINEIWSVDLAYVDKLAKYNNGVNYLLVAVDVLSRYLRVEPMKTKEAKDCAAAFAKMIKKKKPEKVWTDKGTEFKGAFKKFCTRRGIDTYTTQSETKSAFAERNIRSLKNIIYKFLEDKWRWKYIDHLSEFVNTINSRVNRVTKLAPNKVFKKHETYLVSLNAEKSNKFLRKPKFEKGDLVRIAKLDLPFRKGYKQSFTDEVFEIERIATLNPPTYNLLDARKEKILGKFYEQELVQVDTLYSSESEDET